MRKLVVILCILSALPALATTVARRRARARGRQFLHETTKPSSLIRHGAGAGIRTATNSPHEWGQGASGFGKRFASGLGQSATTGGIGLVVGAIRHEDLRYDTRHHPTFGGKMKAAAANTFLARDARNRRRKVATGRVSGAIGGGLISRAWQPASTRSVASGLASGGITLGTEYGANVAREFWPQHKKPVAHRRVYRSARAHRAA